MDAQALLSLRALLEAGEAQAALTTAQSLLRQVGSRAEGKALFTALSELTPEGLGTTWQEVYAWAAFRAGEMEALDTALGALGEAAPLALRAAGAGTRGEWAEARRLCEVAQMTGPMSDLERFTLARFQAKALAAQEAPGWLEAFETAEALPAPARDLGLLLLEKGHALSRLNRDADARVSFGRAAAHFPGDLDFLPLCSANLGIVCLRQGDLAAAQVALRRALALAQRSGEGRYLSTAWRGLGGVFVRLRQWPRAEHAYRQAERLAQDISQTVQARRSRARLLRFQGELDASGTLLHSALLHLSWPPGRAHPVHTDLAEGYLLQGQAGAAREALRLGACEQPQDRWRAELLEAELARQGGGVPTLPSLEPGEPWWAEQVWLFPELLAGFGMSPPPAFSWEITLRADGPLRLEELGAPASALTNHPALRVLAFLLASGGSAATERLLDALSIQGQGPRQQRQTLSRLTGKLREWLGWEGAVLVQGGTLTLGEGPSWRLIYPPPHQADLFCEGCYDPWVTEWRSEQGLLNFSDSF